MAMAARRVVRFVDDLDGTAASETVWFGLDGVGYELDLSAANAAALRSVLGHYVAAARPVGRVEAGATGRVRHALTRAQHATAAAAVPPPAVTPADPPAEPPTATEPPTAPEPPVATVPVAHRPATHRPAQPAKPRFSHLPTPPTPTPR
jgi:hypothetical protein